MAVMGDRDGVAFRRRLARPAIEEATPVARSRRLHAELIEALLSPPLGTRDLVRDSPITPRAQATPPRSSNTHRPRHGKLPPRAPIARLHVSTRAEPSASARRFRRTQTRHVRRGLRAAGPDWLLRMLAEAALLFEIAGDHLGGALLVRLNRRGAQTPKRTRPGW